MNGMKAYQGRSHREIHGISTALRRQLGLGLFDKVQPHILRDRMLDMKLSDLVPLPESLKDCEIDIELRESMQSEGEAEFDPQERRFKLSFPAGTYSKWIHDDARSRFTFSHEVLHLVLHHRELVDLRRLPHQEQLALHRNQGTHQVFQDVEWQANAGAGFFSAPAEGCAQLWKHYGTFESIMDAYGISYTAARMRVANLMEHGAKYGVSL